MGLGGAARPARALGLGRQGVPAGRGAGALGAVARRGWPTSMDQPHLIEGLDRVTRALGGLHRSVAVRPDGHRRAPGIRPGHRVVRRGRQALRRVRAACPPRRGNRKGVVEKANHTAAQRWWRTLADDVTPGAGPGCAWTRGAPRRGDVRLRATADGNGHRRPPSPRASRCARRRRRRSRPILSVAAHGVGAGAGGLPRQPLLGATRAGPGRGHRAAPARRRHLDIATAAGTVIARHAPGTGRGRGDGPRPRPRPGPGTGRDGRGQPGRAAPPQATHPTRPAARAAATPCAPRPARPPARRASA